MADNVSNELIYATLRAMQSTLADIDKRLSALERFQGALVHTQNGIMAHLAGIHDSIEELKADMRATKQRMDAVEAR